MSNQNVLLVDDEAIERKVLEKILMEHLPVNQSLTVYQAKNGKEAIDLCLSESIDIVFMDINMPVMDGLQATQAIKAMDSRIDIIMVSAYDTFDYAKQAIDYGVKAYLLKPASVEEVIAVFSKVREQREFNQTEAASKQKLLSRVNFIEALIGDGSHDFTEKAAVALVSAQVKERIVTRIVDSPIISGPVLGAYLPLAVIGIDKTEEALAILKQLCLKEPTIRFSLGRLKPHEQIRESYEEALMSYYDLIDREDIAYSVYKEHVATMVYDIDQCQNQLIEAIEKGDKAQLDQCFNRYNHTLSQLTDQQVPRMKRYMMLLLDQLKDLFLTDSVLALKQQLMLTTHREALMALVKEFLVRETDNLQSRLAQASPVERAVRYVDEHFTDAHLSLEQLATEVSLSVYHLSKTFKQHTGHSFVDYIREKRLSYAKQLLREQELPLKAVAYESGFSDPNYFSRLFKKSTGIPPSKYLKKLES